MVQNRLSGGFFGISAKSKRACRLDFLFRPRYNRKKKNGNEERQKHMKYDGILFDLDGTLWNATEAIAVAWQMALEDAPDISRPPTVEELQGVMGMTAEELMAALFPHITPERGAELFERCCQVENDYLLRHGGKLYKGMEELLDTLSRQVPLAIVSNCNTEYAPCFLKAHKLEKYFADWECSGRTGLPKGENIKLVVERNHLQAPVYVGDTTMDYEATRVAGVPFIHAAYGFGKVEGVPAIHCPLELLELVK